MVNSIPQALEGIRVLDLSQGIAGPYCTKLMASLGAEVIKIEDPSEGDISRQMGPFFRYDPHHETSATYLYLNTSKRGVTLNVDTTTGAEILKNLAVEADVVVESYSAGVMASLGLDYSVLEKVNPRLIMVSITYFGQTGPYKNYKGNPMIAYATAGQMYMNGEPDKEPLKGAGYFPEYQAGIHAMDAILAALYWRESSKEGQYIDVSVMEAFAYYHEFAITAWTHLKLQNMRSGNRYVVGNHPLTLYPCKDGWVSVTVVTPQQTENLFLLIGRPDLLENSCFATNYTRWLNADQLDQIMTDWLKDYTMDQVVAQAQELRIPVAHVPTFGRLFNDPNLQARDYWVAIEHPCVGLQKYAGQPFRMSETPWQVNRAPLMGEHNQSVYGGILGLSRQDLVRLRERGII